MDRRELTHTWACHALRRVVDALAEHGIPALPVKGVVLAHQLYDRPSERALSDVDLRVRRRHLDGAVRAARAAGFACVQASRRYANVVLDVAGMPVDIESTVGPPGLCALDVEELFARAVPWTTPAGWHCLAPELHDHAVLLVVNAFKDRLTYESAASDLARIVRVTAFDRVTFLERAERAEILTLTWIVAEWMAARRDAIWRAIARELEPRVPRPRYAAFLRARLLRTRCHGLVERVATRAGADDWRRGARAVVTAGAWVLESRRG